MAKAARFYVCQNCGGTQRQWVGQCPDCQEWNTLSEQVDVAGPALKRARPNTGKDSLITFFDLNDLPEPVARLDTGIEELNRVSGGGLVPGSALLIGGDPGIGKSTLLLQMAAHMARSGKNIAYISGEESIEQVQRRARRLELSGSPLKLACETMLTRILNSLNQHKPDVVIIDSIQTLWHDEISAAPGTLSQVRICAQELVRHAKAYGICVLLVGHVTKDGQIAGPRVVEHMVDAVLYFEGDREGQFRILRAHKNRFGASDEIGVFTMQEKGLVEVSNPSALFLDGRGKNVSGTAVFAGLEGTRPVLSEIQALVAPTRFGTPRRATLGWDNGRLAMVIAVLEARCGVNFAQYDVYLNVAGGLKINEAAADLAVACALVSSLYDITMPAESVIFGEISLSGDVRTVGREDARLREAQKLGFKNAIIAKPNEMPVSSKLNTSLLVCTYVTVLADVITYLKDYETAKN